MKKMLLVSLFLLSFVLVSCTNNIDSTDRPFIVSFYNGETLLKESEYDFGGKITDIPSTTLNDRIFMGWYLTPHFDSSPVDLSQIIVINDLNIYGKWINFEIYFTGYYEPLNNLGSQSLESALTKMIKNTGTATGTTAQVKQADQWQNQHYNIYDGLGTYGNREHVWPNSKLGNAPEFDLHNLRAAKITTNSTRGNYKFAEASGSWKMTNYGFYPGDEHIGDVARIVLYISVRYNLDLDLVGDLNMFLKWHQADPVNDFELTRNGRIYTIQGNRNPFIDHPDLVALLFGLPQSTTTFDTNQSFNFMNSTYSFNNIFVN